MAAVEKIGVPKDRTIRLGQSKFFSDVFAEPVISCARGYMGETSIRGADVVGDTSEAHKLPRQCNALHLMHSATHEGDIVGLPVMNAGEDDLELTWADQGKVARAHLGRLMELLSIKIPDRTRMVIKLYPDTDPEHGAVVGFQIAGMQFVPVEARERSGTQAGQ